MKRELSELRKTYGEKITLLERLLIQARQELLLSEQRNEITALIAVMLRSLFCKDRSGIPLITSTQLENDFIFPLRNSFEAYNELKGTLLVEYKITGDKCCFISTSLSADQVPRNYLSFNNWISEIVVDFKMEGYPPLSREEVIKTIADKNGAHYDVNLDKYSACLESGKVVFLEFVIDGQKCLFDSKNLLSETLLTIADEVLFSYKYLRSPELTAPSQSENVINVFDFSVENWSRYKYSICPPTVNKYNTNKYYPCSITTHPLMTYNLKFRERWFNVGVIRIDGLDKGSIGECAS